jgi:hypothetical protein
MYIQKSVSENTQNAVLGVENTDTPNLPTITYNIIPNFFVTNNHLSSLHTQYSMVAFCKCPHRQILKILIVKINYLNSYSYYLNSI